MNVRLSAPVPTRVARALVLAGNMLHSVGASLLASGNDELADELARARARITWLENRLEELHREHQSAKAADPGEHQGDGAAFDVFLIDEDKRAAWQEAHPGTVAIDFLEPPNADELEVPQWLGFGGGEIRDRV